MLVRMARKIRVAEFETMDLLIEYTDANMPLTENETIPEWTTRVKLAIYKEILAHQVFHGVLNVDQAKQEIARFREFYKIPKT